MTKKIAILATDYFEDSELSEAYKRLLDACFKVSVVGPTAAVEIVAKNIKFKLKTDLAKAANGLTLRLGRPHSCSI